LGWVLCTIAFFRSLNHIVAVLARDGDELNLRWNLVQVGGQISLDFFIAGLKVVG
jgi:hypothetical protein